MPRRTFGKTVSQRSPLVDKGDLLANFWRTASCFLERFIRPAASSLDKTQCPPQSRSLSDEGGEKDPVDSVHAYFAFVNTVPVSATVADRIAVPALL